MHYYMSHSTIHNPLMPTEFYLGPVDAGRVLYSTWFMPSSTMGMLYTMAPWAPPGHHGYTRAPTAGTRCSHDRACSAASRSDLAVGLTSGIPVSAIWEQK